VAYGIEVSPSRLARVERAETAVRALLDAAGTPVRDLRIRDLGDRASVEVDADLAPVLAADLRIVEAVVAAGFDAAEVDPRGFRSGAMNERLTDAERYR
jgi:uncharacterized protein